MSPNTRHLVLQRAARLFDVAIVSVTFSTSLIINSGAFTWPTLAHVFGMRIALINVLLFGGYLTACSAVFSVCGFYRAHRLSHRSGRTRELIVAVTLITVVLFVLRGALDLQFATNQFLIEFIALTFTAFLLSREIGQRLLSYARGRGRSLRNVIIVGEGSDASALAARIQNDVNLGYCVLKIIDAKENQQ